MFSASLNGLRDGDIAEIGEEPPAIMDVDFSETYLRSVREKIHSNNNQIPRNKFLTIEGGLSDFVSEFSEDAQLVESLNKPERLMETVPKTERNSVKRPDHIEEGEYFSARNLKKQKLDLHKSVFLENTLKIENQHNQIEYKPNKKMSTATKLAKMEEYMKIVAKSIEELLKSAPDMLEFQKNLSNPNLSGSKDAIKMAALLKLKHKQGKLQIFNEIIDYKGGDLVLPGKDFGLATQIIPQRFAPLTPLEIEFCHDPKFLPPLPKITNPKIHYTALMHQDTLFMHKEYVSDVEHHLNNSRQYRMLGRNVLLSVMGRIVYDEMPYLSDSESTRIRSELINPQLLTGWALSYGFHDALKNLPIGQYSDAQLRVVFSDVFLSYIGGLISDETSDSSGLFRMFQMLTKPYIDDYNSQLGIGYIGVPKYSKVKLDDLLLSYTDGPTYSVISKGDGLSRPYIVELKVGKQVIGMGISMNKKEASLNAAGNALKSHYVKKLEKDIEMNKIEKHNQPENELPTPVSRDNEMLGISIPQQTYDFQGNKPQAPQPGLSFPPSLLSPAKTGSGSVNSWTPGSISGKYSEEPEVETHMNNVISGLFPASNQSETTETSQTSNSPSVYHSNINPYPPQLQNQHQALVNYNSPPVNSVALVPQGQNQNVFIPSFETGGATVTAINMNHEMMIRTREQFPNLPLICSSFREIDKTSKDKLYSMCNKTLGIKPEYYVERVVDGYKTLLLIHDIIVVIAVDRNKKDASQRCAMTLLEHEDVMRDLRLI